MILKSKISYRMYVIIAVFSAMAFGCMYGVKILNPYYTDWLIHGDAAQHYLGWVAYKESYWNFPLGITNYLEHPHWVSVIFTDSIPLFAVIFKLFSPIFSGNFQYIGWWGILCFMLQGCFAARIINKYSDSNIKTIISSLLVVMMPAFLKRFSCGHEALAGQWLILFSLDLIFNYEKYVKNRKYLFFSVAGIAFFSVAIHMYFLLMCGIIVFSYCVIDVLCNKKIMRNLLVLVVFCATALFTLWILGGFSSTGVDYRLNDFGVYNMNLNALFNPRGASTILSELGGTPEQGEGYGYLGLGVIVLSFFSLVCLVVGKKCYSFKENKGKIIGIFCAVILTAIIAIQKTVSIGNTKLFEFKFPEIVVRIWGIFRASGRIVMVIDYVIVLSAIVILLKLIKKKNVVVLFMLLCLIFQICDLYSGSLRAEYLLHFSDTTHVSALGSPEIWESVAQNDNIHHVIIADWIGDDEYYDVAKWALNNGMTMSSFPIAHAKCDDIRERIEQYLESPTDDEIFIFLADDKLELSKYDMNYYDVGRYIIGYVGELDNVRKISQSELNKKEYIFSNNECLLNGQDVDGIRTIFPDGVSFGPYWNIAAKRCRITIRGNNLKDNSSIVIKGSRGAKEYNYNVISKKDNEIVVEIERIDDTDMEVVVGNTSNMNLSLEGILFEKVGE